MTVPTPAELRMPGPELCRAYAEADDEIHLVVWRSMTQAGDGRDGSA